MSGTEWPAIGRTSSEAAFCVCQLSPPNTCGSSASGGSGGNVLRRETTSSMTRVMSVPTSKLSRTPPRPRFDSERISTMPGRPRIASSIGSISASSSSAGAASRHSALTKSCGWRVSGSSWIGSRMSASTPNSSTMAAAAATAGGFWRQRSESFMDSPEGAAGVRRSSLPDDATDAAADEAARGRPATSRCPLGYACRPRATARCCRRCARARSSDGTEAKIVYSGDRFFLAQSPRQQQVGRISVVRESGERSR